jgi:large subunit ribosomal protein L5
MADDKEKPKHPKQPKSGQADAHHKGGGGADKGGGDKGGHGPKKEKKAKGGPAEAQIELADDSPKVPAPPARLIEFYRTKVAPALGEKFGYRNLLAAPRLERIVISMGLGRFAVEGGDGKGKFERAEKELTVIAGQRPVRCKAKKSVANFKVRQGMETGLKVTLRGARMYEFLDRMISLAIPRVKDFRGLDPKAFDKDGNYNFGFTEQTVFPEVNAAEIQFPQGMNVTLVTTATNAEEGRELLRQFGFPFRTDSKDGKEARPVAAAPAPAAQ